MIHLVGSGRGTRRGSGAEPPARGAAAVPVADRIVVALALVLLATGLGLGLRHAHPIVYERAGGATEVDPRDCGRVLTPRCDWRRESVEAAATTVAGVALVAATVACARARRRAPRRASTSIGPPEQLTMAGALVQVALPVFVVGLGLVLLVYHLQLMDRLGD